MHIRPWPWGHGEDKGREQHPSNDWAAFDKATSAKKRELAQVASLPLAARNWVLNKEW